MADADEDTIRSNTADPESIDISDETQDFRFLSSLSQYKSGEPSSLPRRGEKDFEHHGLRAQEDVLAASRQAMHDALCHVRLHKPHGLTGYYDPDTQTCVIDEPRGGNLQNIGKNDSHGRLMLLPEEALYLLERGSLSLLWSGGDLCDVPLSLQAAYAYLIGSQGLTVERYLVYAGLRRSGYILQRTSTWASAEHEDSVALLKHQSRQQVTTPTWFQQLYAYLTAVRPQPDTAPLGPIVQPGLYRSYAPIYRRLALIPFHDARLTNSTSSMQAASEQKSSQSQEPLRPAYHVWKPTPSFRKTAPPQPDYNICVLDAHTQPFPTLDHMDELMQYMPYTPPPEHSQGKTYVRLRHGYRRVILAIVDQGIISYVGFTDSAFGLEPVWDRGPRGGGKGGRGRARGGGNARGRGGGQANRGK